MKCSPMRFRERQFDPRRDMPLPTGRKVIGMTRYSVATSKRVPCAPMGDYVWRLSRQVILSGPFAYGWGRTQRKWVYYMRGRRNP